MRARKKLYAELLFELADVPADGRLRDIIPAGSLGEIERLRGEAAQKENLQKNLAILRENFLGNLVKGKLKKEQIFEQMMTENAKGN